MASVVGQTLHAGAAPLTEEAAVFCKPCDKNCPNVVNECVQSFSKAKFSLCKARLIVLGLGKLAERGEFVKSSYAALRTLWKGVADFP